MEKRKYILLSALIVVFVLMVLPQVSKAAIYELHVFTTNGGYYNHPELDLSVEVSEQGSQVRFEFHNDSTFDSSIQGVYFDDGSLLGIAGIDEGPGTAFSLGGSPPNLPGGQVLVPPFVTSQGFLAESDPPPSSNGVEPDEWMAVVFDLLEGVTIDDVLDELDTHTSDRRTLDKPSRRLQ